jgi:lactoylglutathione lyase
MSLSNEVEHLSRLWMWGDDVEQTRVLHTALRVEDIERSMKFYVDGVGMKVIERINIAPRRVKVVFLGFDGDDYRAGGFLELVRYLDHEGPYAQGEAFHHVSFGVADTRAVVARLEAMGTEVTVPPGREGDGPWISFVKDPDGYTVEFIQTLGEPAAG